MRLVVGGLIALLDGLTRVVGRLYDRIDADYAERTKLLRARYAARQHTPDEVAPGPVALAERSLR